MPQARDPSKGAIGGVIGARDRFTNRVNETRRFVDLLQTHQGLLPLLMFYGVGGAGKSALLDHLQLECDTLGVPWASLDLEQYREPNSGLLSMYNHLNKTYQWRFQRFERTTAVYYARFGTGSGDEKPTSVLASKGIDLILDGLGLVPAIGSIASIIKIAKTGAETVWQEYDGLKKLGADRQTFQRLNHLNASDFHLEFVNAFAEDLIHVVPDRNGPIGRCVLFFDTHESLWMDGKAGFNPNDGWIKHLRENLHDQGVLMVMAGRDSLNWGESDLGWLVTDHQNRRVWLEEHLIGGLSRKDALEFLRRADTNLYPNDPFLMPPDLQEAILRVSNEAPPGQESAHFCYLLGLCAEIVSNHKRTAGAYPSADEFTRIPSGEVQQRLIGRFLQSLNNQNMVNWLEELSVTPRFDEGFALRFSERRGHRNTPADWQRLSALSLLEKHESTGFYQMHKLLRTGLLQRVPTTKVVQIHGLARELWQEISNKETEDPRLGLTWYHWNAIDQHTAQSDFQSQWDQAMQYARPQTLEYLLRWWDDIELQAKPCTVDEAHHLRKYAVFLMGTSLGDRSSRLSDAIGYLRNALQFLTPIEHPTDWAMTQNNLGNAYSRLPSGDFEANLKSAIDCFHFALEVYTKADYPKDWAKLQINLGNSYLDLQTGDRAVNLENAIDMYTHALEVYTKTDNPMEWAVAQNNLGNAFRDIPTGDRAINLENAIVCYFQALEVRSKSGYPADWATTQNNLGLAYMGLLEGDRASSIRKAIDCFTWALEVRTRWGYPADWARLQNNLGNAYSELPNGDREENLKAGMDCYNRALEVFTKEDYPANWAMLQDNLGLTFMELATGDRGLNLEKAKSLFQAAKEGFEAIGMRRDAEAASTNLEDLERILNGWNAVEKH